MKFQIIRMVLSISTFLLLSISTTFAQETSHVVLDSLNSSYDEHSPMLSPDGQRLYFTRAGHPANIGGVLDQGDIWYAEKSGNGWSRPIHAGSVLNHPGLNGVVGFSADGNRMYTLNYFDSEARAGSKLKNGISVAQMSGGDWLKPELLPIKFFSNTSSHISATISRDEKVLIMSIISYNTEGNEDLYYSLKGENNDWSQPKTLGTSINTFAEEWTPYLGSDNKTLYFTSNGHEGFGSRDIFVSEKQGNSWESWSTPKNLGNAINTKGVEQGYSIPFSGTMAYFSSTQNSEGFGDLFGFPIDKEEPTIIEVPVVDEPTPQPEPATLIDTVRVPVPNIDIVFMVMDQRSLNDIDGEVTLAYGGATRRVAADEYTAVGQKRVLKVSFKPGTEVNITVQAPGFLNFERQFTVNKGTAGIQELFLVAEEVGTKVKIENVLFRRASAEFADEETAQKQIDELIGLMNANPGMAIRLEGHTDNRGDAKLSKDLSEERVKTVRDYMISKGISGSRIEFIGYGGERPLNNTNSVAAREVNRRVEFVIIK
ncbi:OmpA family protein [Roseivirga sp.]|uniref:OmpA family protein n=1 Tax=Roseivirga sp. TaxID=1964215 RepID=UPI003B8AE1F4